MAGSVNKVILVGNLGKDPEIRSTQDGREIASFSLATSETWKDKNSGERKEKTEWHNIVIFNPNLVTVVKNYVKKGSKLYIEGALQTRKWTDKEGHDRYSTEVVLQNYNGSLTMLDGNKGGDSSSAGGYGGSNSNYSGAGSSGGSSFGQMPASKPAGELLDDEIPF
jgi:single-strand DNA-binding protein